MATYTVQGTTLSFASSSQPVIQFKFSDDGNPNDVTTLADAVHKFVNTTAKQELTATILGPGAALTRGATGALAITFADASTITGSVNFLIVKREEGAEVDGKRTVDVTLSPYGG